MGLDVVELVMDIEDIFDITIPDDDYEKLRTVGDLHEYIIERRPDMDASTTERSRVDGCLSTFVFLKLRSALSTLVPLTRTDFRPHASLEQFIPRDNRRQLWDDLQQTTALHLPSLCLPGTIVLLLAIVVTTVTTISMLLFLPHAGIPGSTFCALSLCLPLIVLGYKWSRPLACEFPWKRPTVRTLTEALIGGNYLTLSEQHGTWDGDAIWHALVAIISHNLSVKPELVVPEASFIDDLGAN